MTSYNPAIHLLDPEHYALLLKVRSRVKISMNKMRKWLLTFPHLLCIKTVLARDPNSAGPAGISELKFNSQVGKFISGEFVDAASGLPKLLQVNERELHLKVDAGLPALEEEIRAFANEELIAAFLYVVREVCSELKYPNGIRDKGHAGKVRSSRRRRRRRRRRVIESF